MRGKRKNSLKLIFILIGISVVAAFPALSMYFQNVSEAVFGEVLPVMICFILAGYILFGIAFAALRDSAKAGLVTCLCLVVFLNYSFVEGIIQSVVPALRYWHIVPILAFVIILLAAILKKRVSGENSRLFMNIITVVFCVLVVFNFAMAVPTMIARKQSEMNTVQYTDGNSPEADSEMPNIYYLLFDEYSGYNFMLKYYEYDNSVFIEKLKSKNFSVSYSSYNESVSTETVITNLMNLNYVVDDSWTSYDKSEVRKNGELYKLLTKHGYKLYSLTDRYGLPLIDEQERENEAVTISGETLRSILIKNTVVYPLLSVNRQGLQTTIDSIERFICREEKSRFFISHLLLPHQPFIFDRDGNIIKNVNTNWKDKKYYLDQFIYATKVMEELIDCILKHDPDSIIILQSDHSARASTDSDIFKVVFKMEDMTNCFNCVYYMGKPVDIEGLSGVNTDRLLLGMLLDEELPPLEVPRLEVNGFDKGE